MARKPKSKTTGAPSKEGAPGRLPAKGSPQSYQLVIGQYLDAMWVQALRDLARLGFEPDLETLSAAGPRWRDRDMYAEHMRALSHPKKPQLVAGHVHTLQKVAECRRHIARGDAWALAYCIHGLHPSHVRYLARLGEKSLTGAREGGESRRKADRDQRLPARYHEIRKTSPKLGKVSAVHRAGQDEGMKPCASYKAISKLLEEAGDEN